MTTTTRLGHAENSSHEDGTAVARIRTCDAWVRATHFTHPEEERAASDRPGEFAEIVLHDVASVRIFSEETSDGSPTIELVTRDINGRTCYIRMFGIDALAIVSALVKAATE
jgi:hypothetical protein